MLILIIFEISVPLYELLPEENIAFVVLFSISIYLFYRTQKRSENYQYNQMSTLTDQSTFLLIDNQNAESIGPEKIESPHHCDTKTVNLLQNEYNFWLNCYIGPYNRRYYYYGCGFGVATLLLCSNLMLTTICRPFLFATIFGVWILLPENCEEAYYLFEYESLFII